MSYKSRIRLNMLEDRCVPAALGSVQLAATADAAEATITMDAFLASFGSLKGDAAFDTRADFDSDGDVDGVDFLTMRTAQPLEDAGAGAEPVQDAFLAHFGMTANDLGFDASFDFDADGDIDGVDFLTYRDKLLADGGGAGAGAGAVDLNAFATAFGSIKSDLNYNSAFDLDADGDVDGLDFLQIRNVIFAGDNGGGGGAGAIDFQALATSFGSVKGDANFIPAFDLDGDNDVDGLDFLMIRDLMFPNDNGAGAAAQDVAALSPVVIR